jgi:catechol 2,3-dioxygenase-like lactoylglutathione lyase family enzyme
MPKVSSLGHVGLFVSDLPKMRDFYTRVLGMTVTDESAERQMCFLSARPGEEHHEMFLTVGRDAEDVKVVQQVSFHVDSLEELREFHHTFKAEGVEIDSVVSHGNTASIYFRDPDRNRLEVYFSIPVEWPQPFRVAIDIERSDEAVLQQIHDATYGAAAAAK